MEHISGFYYYYWEINIYCFQAQATQAIMENTVSLTDQEETLQINPSPIVSAVMENIWRTLTVNPHAGSQRSSNGIVNVCPVNFSVLLSF